jgi:hypothetical protein
MLSDTNNTGQRYLFSQGSGTSTTRNQLGIFLENTNNANTPLGTANSLKLRVGNGPTTVVLSNQFLVANAWYYFATTWDETRNSAGGGEVRFYIGQAGGTLSSGAIDIGNDSVVGDNGTNFIGNRDLLNAGYRSPGSGVIDDFAVWNEELTVDEITAQFNAALNAPAVVGPPPQLSIVISGPNALISWPASTSSSYLLETTNVLSSSGAAIWPSAGASSIVGTNYVVTNVLSTGSSFYRLHKF